MYVRKPCCKHILWRSYILRRMGHQCLLSQIKINRWNNERIIGREVSLYEIDYISLLKESIMYYSPFTSREQPSIKIHQ